MKTRKIEEEKTTREKLLQSAEQLFAEKGFDGVSVRDIANDAKVNSALLGYYFRGKEGLLTEVYTRHCEPLKQERARLLAQCRSNGREPTLEQILESFIRPSLHVGKGDEQGRSFYRLRAILSAENSLLLEQLVSQNFDESTRAFVRALAKCLPNLSKQDIFWRFHFLLGAIYYTATGPYRIKTLSRGKCDPTNEEAATRELVDFAAAGFRSSAAPVKVDVRKTTRKPANGARD